MRIFTETHFEIVAQKLVNAGIGEVHERLLNISLDEGINYINRLKENRKIQDKSIKKDKEFLIDFELKNLSPNR